MEHDAIAVDRALELLWQAARPSRPLRDAVDVARSEIMRLRGAVRAALAAVAEPDSCRNYEDDGEVATGTCIDNETEPRCDVCAAILALSSGLPR